MFLQNKYHNTLSGLFDDHNSLQSQIEQYDDLPAELSGWLGRLKLLYGVPLNYLIPNENMLPPESIRFFYLDNNWINAIVDGAYSIGRSLDPEETTNSFKMDRASTPLMSDNSDKKASAIRSGFLGLTAKGTDMQIVSGFLLRSSVVADYPGLGVNAYSKEENELNILRMERLTPAADVLFCLIEGDLHRMDIHEAPEALHYGIDKYETKAGAPYGTKTVFPYQKGGEQGEHSVTMEMENPKKIELDATSVFRTKDGSRTINMASLAKAIAQETSPDKAIDASEMGFEMTEGVGMVSFCNKKN